MPQPRIALWDSSLQKAVAKFKCCRLVQKRKDTRKSAVLFSTCEETNGIALNDGSLEEGFEKVMLIHG